MTSSVIPVFVFPDSLRFSRSQSTRTLAIYNPYDFGLKFQSILRKENNFYFNVFILKFCRQIPTHSRSQTVQDSCVRVTRLICMSLKRITRANNAFCLILRVIRLRDSNSCKNAKLLVSVCEHSSGARTGERQVDVSVVDEEEEKEIQKHSFVACAHTGGVSTESREMAPKETNNQILSVCLALVCALVLLLPHEGDHWLTVGVTHKLVVIHCCFWVPPLCLIL